MPAIGGIALEGSPYRWQTISPGRHDPLTIVGRIDRRGGRVGRWWYLKGGWYMAAPAYDGVGAALSGDEGTLVLARLESEWQGPRTRTRLAILATGAHLRHPHRPGHSPPGHAIHYLDLAGNYGVYALSPDGSTLFLTHLLSLSPSGARFTIVPYDLRSDRLLSPRRIGGNGEILSGPATARAEDVSGHRVYTLYLEQRPDGRHMYLLALDTFGRSLAKVELPRLRNWKDPLLAVAGISRAFAPGTRGGAFPQVDGWCCRSAR